MPGFNHTAIGVFKSTPGNFFIAGPDVSTQLVFLDRHWFFAAVKMRSAIPQKVMSSQLFTDAPEKCRVEWVQNVFAALQCRIVVTRNVDVDR